MPQSLIPVVMSGIIAVYALVIGVLIAGDMKAPPESYSLFSGFLHLGCGLSVGLAGLAAGYAIGIVGDTVRPTSRHPKKLPILMQSAGSSRVHATVSYLRRHGPYSHFRRSPGSLRVRISVSLMILLR
jgi:F0F1-type ATP synthase membrane subunit c/vacuolar-type H+-ATPase subunit K